MDQQECMSSLDSISSKMRQLLFAILSTICFSGLAKGSLNVSWDNSPGPFLHTLTFLIFSSSLLDNMGELGFNVISSSTSSPFFHHS